MATQSAPLDRQDFQNLATMLVSRATAIDKAISVDKPNVAELAKHLKSVKLLVGLCDGEIKKLRSQK